MPNKAVFLDRDGTIIEDPGYLSDPAGVRLLPGAAEAIRTLSRAGYKIVVVTNQSGVARGLITEDDLRRIHNELNRLLAEKSARLDGIYYCPYHPQAVVDGYKADSDLRKPRPGMLLRAAAEMDIDLKASWMIGDGPRDIEAGRRAGCGTILIPGSEHPPAPEDSETARTVADFTAADLAAAAGIILRKTGGGSPVPGLPPR